MADEITIVVSATLNNALPAGSSPLQRTFSPNASQITQASKLRGGKSQQLTDAWEAIDTGDVTEGYIFLMNLDDTCSVQFGPLPAGSGAMPELLGQLDPGDPPACFHLASGVTLYARAQTGSSPTATVEVEIWSK